MTLYPRSIIEVSEIGRDAANLLKDDLAHWLGNKVAQLDQWLCDYGNEDRDD